MKNNLAKQLSLGLQPLAGLIQDNLERLAGEPIAFVLVIQADEVAQYVSNTKREDGADLIKSLLDRWEAGRADIPAHYNPDLNKPHPDTDLLNWMERTGVMAIDKTPDGNFHMVTGVAQPNCYGVTLRDALKLARKQRGEE